MGVYYNIVPEAFSYHIGEIPLETTHREKMAKLSLVTHFVKMILEHTICQFAVFLLSPRPDL